MVIDKLRAYLTMNGDGTFNGYVGGRGFRANSTLAECTKFIRENIGRTSGSVPCFDRESREWSSEIDIAEDA